MEKFSYFYIVFYYIKLKIGYYLYKMKKIKTKVFQKFLNRVSEHEINEVLFLILKYSLNFYITSSLYKIIVYRKVPFSNKTLNKYLFLKKRANFEASDFQKY